MAPLDARDVRIMIPQVRRALDPGVASASAAASYDDDMIAAVTADAVAELLAIAGPINFPFILSATATDSAGYPTEWQTDPALPFEVQALVVAQVALKEAFNQLNDIKTSEKVSSQGGAWEWTKSPNILRDRVSFLMRMRDDALKNAVRVIPTLDAFVDLIPLRDATAAADIEP